MSSFIAIALQIVDSLWKTLRLPTSLPRGLRGQPPRAHRTISEAEPFIRHYTIHASDLIGRNLLIVGDVHGCYEEMVQLIDVAQAKTPERPLTVVFVGDLVRKGPRSLDVLRYVRTTPHTFSVRGNHEEKVVRSILASKRGKGHTLVSNNDLRWLHQLEGEDYDFLKSLPYTLSIPALDVILVHGGLFPGHELSAQDPQTMMTMREVTLGHDWFHGAILRPCIGDEDGQGWAQFWCGPQHVYFGHDSARGLQQHRYATGLDSSCVYGGKLTGCLMKLEENEQTVMCLEREIVQLDAKKQYRPIKSKSLFSFT